MTLILKVTDACGPSLSPDDAEYGLFADIVSIHFRRFEDGSGAEALCYCREPIKTAEVPGFCEVEKRIVFKNAAYVMNENGKTISRFIVNVAVPFVQARAA